jgi:hypothetical protein
MSNDMSGMKDMDMGSISEMNHDAAPQSGGPDVIFHSGFSKDGLYKMREQFRHEGKIITAPFVLNVGQGAMKTATPYEYSMGRKNRAKCGLHLLDALQSAIDNTWRLSQVRHGTGSKCLTIVWLLEPNFAVID